MTTTPRSIAPPKSASEASSSRRAKRSTACSTPEVGTGTRSASSPPWKSSTCAGELGSSLARTSRRWVVTVPSGATARTSTMPCASPLAGGGKSSASGGSGWAARSSGAGAPAPPDSVTPALGSAPPLFLSVTTSWSLTMKTRRATRSPSAALPSAAVPRSGTSKRSSRSTSSLTEAAAAASSSSSSADSARTSNHSPTASNAASAKSRANSRKRSVIGALASAGRRPRSKGRAVRSRRLSPPIRWRPRDTGAA